MKNERLITRRSFIIGAGAVTGVALGVACHRSEHNDGRLSARPRTEVKPGALNLGGDVIVQLPKTPTNNPLPLLVFLHGAGQNNEEMIEYIGQAADEAGIALVVPNSRDQTWDAIRGSFGPDVTFLNQMLERVFEVMPVDPNRLAIGGFSDGATYALSLGLINGDLFSRIAAFSPGFVVAGTAHGKPKIFISHGSSDHILPIGRTSRRIVPDLQDRGYEVTFREFDGDHEVPPAVAREGAQWLVV